MWLCSTLHCDVAKHVTSFVTCILKISGTSWTDRRHRRECVSLKSSRIVLPASAQLFSTIKDVTSLLVGFSETVLHLRAQVFFFVHPILVCRVKKITMAGATSLEAVKRKIKSLQDQADGAEDRAERLQKQLLEERKAREQVSMLCGQTGAAYPTVRLLV